MMTKALKLVVDNAPYVPNTSRREALHLRLVAGTAFNGVSRDSRQDVLNDPGVQALFTKLGYASDDPTLHALFAPQPAVFEKLSRMPDPWA